MTDVGRRQFLGATVAALVAAGFSDTALGSETAFEQRGPRGDFEIEGGFWRARTEDHLREEMRCWVGGIKDFHDLVIDHVKARRCERYALASKAERVAEFEARIESKRRWTVGRALDPEAHPWGSCPDLRQIGIPRFEENNGKANDARLKTLRTAMDGFQRLGRRWITMSDIGRQTGHSSVAVGAAANAATSAPPHGALASSWVGRPSLGLGSVLRGEGSRSSQPLLSTRGLRRGRRGPLPLWRAGDSDEEDQARRGHALPSLLGHRCRPRPILKRYCPRMHDPTQTRAANLYGSYRRGWLDGSSYRAARPNFEQHEDEEIRTAYLQGLNEGRAAHTLAMGEAQQRYRYTPSILRKSDEEES